MKKIFAVIAFLFLFVFTGCNKIPNAYYYERGESYDTGVFVISLDSYTETLNPDDSVLLKIVVSVENKSNNDDTFTFNNPQVSAPGKDDFYKINSNDNSVFVKAGEKRTKEFQVTIYGNIDTASTFRFKDSNYSRIFYLKAKKINQIGIA